MNPSTAEEQKFKKKKRGPPPAPTPAHLVRNSTSFSVQLSARLRALYAEYQELRLRAAGGDGSEEALTAGALKYYQFLVRAVFTDPGYGLGAGGGNARGLLVFHTMGMGKTLLAVAVAIALWHIRPPVILAPKSLHKNFRQAVDLYVALTSPGLTKEALAAKQAEAFRRFRLVSLDAYNMASQIAKETSGVEGSGAFNDRLLIVDEAHNLFRAIVNSANEKTNARRLYRMVMEARNLRLLFLTGTVPSKDPFELVPCFNMLAGHDLLPSLYDEFYRDYVEGQSVKNRGKLANRLLGLVSHATHALPSAPGAGGAPPADASAGRRREGGFPEELDTVVERVEMSPDQYRQYLQAREQEESEGGGSGGFAPSSDRIVPGAPLALPGSEAAGGSTYYVKSRSLCNFAPPLEVRQRPVSEMPAEAFTPAAAPKIARLLAHLAETPGPALIYSQFVGVGGLAVVARFLRGAGYDEYRPAEPPPPPDRPTFAVISGAVRPDDRDRIQAAFNAPDNAHGAVIKALLVSKTGAEGLDLKGIRQVHILEPYWDKSREEQVKARGVRLGSHDHLPPEEREVRPFLYIAVANPSVLEGIRASAARPVEKETIDERFHRRGLDRLALNGAFRGLLRAVSLECAVNGYGDCRLCVPTAAPLFHEDPARDLRLPDPCRALESSELAAVPITLQGDDEGAPGPFFFHRDPAAPFGVRFFGFDGDLGAYTPVDPSSGLFLRLLGALPDDGGGGPPLFTGGSWGGGGPAGPFPSPAPYLAA